MVSLDKFRIIINGIELHLGQCKCTYSKLPNLVLRKYAGYDFSTGWEIDTGILFENDTIKLHVLIDTLFPNTEIKFAINIPDQYLKWPHIEQQNILCLELPPKDINQEIPDYFVYCIKAAQSFIKEIVSGKLDDDFVKEFVSYWNKKVNSKIQYTSILDWPNTLERAVYKKTTGKEKIFIIGETYKKLTHWLENSLSHTQRKGNIGKIFIIRLENYNLIPEHYPDTINDILALVSECTPHLIKEIEQCIWQQEETQILLAIPDNQSHYGLAGISIRSPRKIKGFRRDSILPDQLKQKRYNEKNNIARHEVQHAEPAWVHGRYVNPSINILREKSVCLVGCGSLGAGVAKLCAAAGIANITLIDHDNLSWANTSRHELGGYMVGKNKAKALEHVLTTSFPDINITSYNTTFENVYKEKTDIFKKHDLIISTTGSWKTECLLNELVQAGNLPTVLLGWVESFALVGHAIVILKEGNNLLDYFVSKDNFNYCIISPESTKNYREMACGNYFQPYGYIELLSTQALIADAVLDFVLGKTSRYEYRCWVGQERKFVENPVTLTDHGMAVIAKYGYGIQLINPLIIKPESKLIAQERGK